MQIKNLEQTCFACPSQWDAQTLDGKYVYIRYRWGGLTLSIDDERVKSLNIGEGFDGVMTTEEMLAHLNLQVIE